MSIVTDHTPFDNSIAGGVDTHADFHVVAAIDTVGRELGHAGLATTTKGNQQLVDWLNNHAPAGRRQRNS